MKKSSFIFFGTILMALTLGLQSFRPSQETEVKVPILGLVLAANDFLRNTELRLDARDGKNASYLLNEAKDFCYRFTIPEFPVQGIARTWTYYVRDIRSQHLELAYEAPFFVLKAHFEGDRSELKGICHGCMGNMKDRRAPDANWEDRRQIDLYFRPGVKNGLLTLLPERTEFHGRMTIDAAFRFIERRGERTMREEVPERLNEMFNNPEVCQKLAVELQKILRKYNLDLPPNIRSVQAVGRHLVIRN